MFLNIFLTFAQNIDCRYTLEPPQCGGSNEYPQSMFWSNNKKNVYPCKPQFYCIKVGCKGVFVTRTCFFVMNCHPQQNTIDTCLTILPSLYIQKHGNKIE